MVKVDIFSGFLGAGKTTLIKKLIEEAYEGEQLVLIENEFGEVGIDGNLFPDSGISVAEINSGCICCSLAGDFSAAFGKIIEQYHPDRILVEPSGVGKLSDIAAAVQGFEGDEVVINSLTTVVDAKKCKMYMKNFGEFFENQVEYATAVILSHTDGISEKKLADAVNVVRECNAEAVLITTPWSELTGAQIVDAIECKDTMEAELEKMMEEHREHMHSHEHHYDENGVCSCGHHHHDHDHDHHDHDHHDHDHDHHDHDHHDHDHHDHDHHDHDHHDHDHHDHDHDHHDHDHDHDHDHHDHNHHDHHDHDHHDHDHHHHEHGETCSCGHDHHHHHDADEVFTSWGMETPDKYTKEQLLEILEAFEDEKTYGMVIRAKGIVENADGGWIHFDYVPGEPVVNEGTAGIIGRLCVIGAQINEEEISRLFGIK